MDSDTSFLDRGIFSDEFFFSMDRKVNKVYVRLWLYENVYALKNCLKIVNNCKFVCIFIDDVMGTFLFCYVTFMEQSYFKLIISYFLRMFLDLPPETTFQLNGAQLHYSRLGRNVLNSRVSASWL